MEDSRLKIRMGSKTVVVKDRVDQVLTVVIAAKDFYFERCCFRALCCSCVDWDLPLLASMP